MFFKASYEEGYAGVSSNASGGYIATNVMLGYGGNAVGQVQGNAIGNVVGSGSQFIFDFYYKLNQ